MLTYSCHAQAVSGYLPWSKTKESKERATILSFHNTRDVNVYQLNTENPPFPLTEEEAPKAGLLAKIWSLHTGLITSTRVLGRSTGTMFLAWRGQSHAHQPGVPLRIPCSSSPCVSSLRIPRESVDSADAIRKDPGLGGRCHGSAGPRMAPHGAHPCASLVRRPALLHAHALLCGSARCPLLEQDAQQLCNEVVL